MTPELTDADRAALLAAARIAYDVPNATYAWVESCDEAIYRAGKLSGRAEAIAEAARDAKRYQWLRGDTSCIDIAECRALPSDATTEQIDAAIDAAMAADEALRAIIARDRALG